METGLELIGVMLASQRSAMLDVLLPRLANEPGLRVCEPAADPAQWPERMAAASPDVLLIDDTLHDPLSIRRLQPRLPATRVLMWCDHATHPLFAKILDDECHGLLQSNTPPETVLKAVRAVCRGELWLPRAMLADLIHRHAHAGQETPGTAATLVGAPGPLTRREAEVVERLRRGRTNKEIGRELGIMEDTVKKHLQSVFAKLGVHRRSLVMLRQAPASPGDR
jgi:DNA-binding NarL/FixJ family response regulator